MLSSIGCCPPRPPLFVCRSYMAPPDTDHVSHITIMTGRGCLSSVSSALWMSWNAGLCVQHAASSGLYKHDDPGTAGESSPCSQPTARMAAQRPTSAHPPTFTARPSSTSSGPLSAPSHLHPCALYTGPHGRNGRSPLPTSQLLSCCCCDHWYHGCGVDYSAWGSLAPPFACFNPLMVAATSGVSVAIPSVFEL